MKVQEQWDFPKFSYCLISACVKDLANIMSVCRSFFLKGESNSIWTKSADACSRNWRIWQPWKLRKLTAIVTQISIDNRCGTLCTVFGKEKNKRQSTVLLVPGQQVLETSGQSLCLPHWRELGNWSPELMFFYIWAHTVSVDPGPGSWQAITS